MSYNFIAPLRFDVICFFQTGKLDPHYPKICGHRGSVLDIKWNPFNDFVIASCSEDATVSLPTCTLHYYLANALFAERNKKQIKRPTDEMQRQNMPGKTNIPFLLLKSDLCDPFQMLYRNQCEQEDLFCGSFCLSGCACMRKTESKFKM